MGSIRPSRQNAESSGREALIEAARALFAERGIEGISIRELGRAAAQRNNNAVQYHFGDREALVLAVIAPHNESVGARRAALLDQLEVGGAAPSIRSIAGALVRPSAAMLEDSAGRDYLRIVAELIAEPANIRRRGPFDHTELSRWNRMAKQSMSESTLPLHRRFSATNLCFSELGRRAASRRRGDHRLFVSDLVDLVTGLLCAEVSEETLRLLKERERASGAPRTVASRRTGLPK